MIQPAPMHDVDLPVMPSQISPSAYALLFEIIDYAGSFPPASLPLQDAFRRYLRFARSDWGWMLARMICPASRLQELSGLIEVDQSARFSILAGGGDSASAFLAQLDADLEAAGRFVGAHGAAADIDQAEGRLPADLLNKDVVAVRRFVDAAAAAFERAGLDAATLFLEVPLDDNLHQTLPVVAGAVRALNRDREERPSFGLKMRTGGTEPEAIPSIDRVARFITTCRDTDVPFKATAGLHHPVRHDAPDVGVPMHGFLNVFVAAILAETHGLSESDVEAILREQRPDQFRIDDQGIGWSHLAADVRAIERGRRCRSLSFGSCSFDEPVSDLITFAYLPSS